MTEVDHITLLRAHGGQLASKRFFQATNGSIGTSGYGNAKHFQAAEVPVANIADLHRVLVDLEACSTAFAIRGALVPGTNPERVLRRKSGKGAVFYEKPRRWVMLDIDGITLPSVTSVLDDPEGAAQAVVDYLAEKAPDLAGVTAVVGFSSSAGLAELAAAEATFGMPPRWQNVAKTGISAHVWVWLKAPLGERELQIWVASLAARGLQLDQATVRTVQPHYVASPVFDPPLQDPLTSRRVWLVQGEVEEAELVIPTFEGRRHSDGGASPARSKYFGGEGGGYLGYVQQIGATSGFHDLIIAAVGSFVSQFGPEGDYRHLKSAIRAQIDRADPGHRPPAKIERYRSEKFLDDLIMWTLERERNKPTKLPVPPGSHRLPAYFAPPAEPREAALARQGNLIAATVHDAAQRAGIRREVAAAIEAEEAAWAANHSDDDADGR